MVWGHAPLPERHGTAIVDRPRMELRPHVILPGSKLLDRQFGGNSLRGSGSELIIAPTFRSKLC